MQQHYHFVAIGGIGMSALAHILLEKGIRVSGSDKQKSAITDDLEKAGAKIFIGYDTQNLPQKKVPIVYSTAVESGNSEFEEAKAKGFPLLHRSEMLRQLLGEKKALLVAGTHGKTTTSSLLTYVLDASGLDPSYAVGGILHNLGKNGGEGKGAYFVAEACESDGTFLHYPGWGGIVTNINWDHLDYWKDRNSLISGFAEFLEKIPSKEHLCYCFDNPPLRELNIRGISYGFDEKAEARIVSSSQKQWMQSYTLMFRGKKFQDIEIPLIGHHNILNSAAVFLLALQLGIEEGAIRKAFSSFKGIGRRVEKKGEKRGIAVYDDYGHHPTEIHTTLTGLKKAIGDRRLIAVFQPHRFTRTRDCFEEFPFAFRAADLLILTDIYSAGEPPIPGIDTQRLFERMESANPGKLFYLPRASLKEGLLTRAEQGDVFLTIGAGDVTKVGSELLELL